jgi:hypothetical protein
MIARILVPVTLAANLRSRLDVKKPRGARRKPRVFSPPERCCERHRVRIAKPSQWNKFFHRIIYCINASQSAAITQLDRSAVVGQLPVCPSLGRYT